MDTPQRRIWNQLFRTPKDVTKQFNKEGFKGTQLDPTYRLEKLTEVFGPVGQGWGFEITDKWRESFPVKGEDVPYVFVQGRLWYVEEGHDKKYTSEQIGGTRCDRAADEGYKMAITDAMGKCCVELGLGADIYMGLHDGGKYSEYIGRKKAEADAETRRKSELAASDKEPPGSKSPPKPAPPPKWDAQKVDKEFVSGVQSDLTDKDSDGLITYGERVTADDVINDETKLATLEVIVRAITAIAQDHAATHTSVEATGKKVASSKIDDRWKPELKRLLGVAWKAKVDLKDTDSQPSSSTGS